MSMEREAKTLYEMPTKQRSPYSVFAREFFRNNKHEYTSHVDLAKALVKTWNEMQDEEKSTYVEKCNKSLEDASELAVASEESPIPYDKDNLKKLKKYIKAGPTYRWEYSGYLSFVNEIFDICGDMTVSPEENVRMFAEMWESLEDEVQNKYRNKALGSLAAKKKPRKRNMGNALRKSDKIYTTSEGLEPSTFGSVGRHSNH
ncbi:hypothetical protein EROM_061230 [Encephalitozoon romaleae SJ-2008]|uniref:HMG box domain-containing protein n=1 Tax=Encephalitozoon romaleae (strain SJ-2008) TaxID=1178016 RepID=I7AEX9_ENCRO|nr:hypothetical protein EROM_061230 [Encephalitozoon romaleae SJ-2008]AFN83215.1 hypothetical protein EROM_061230 [Encephalitozoon romaleae SJ-2008]